MRKVAATFLLASFLCWSIVPREVVADEPKSPQVSDDLKDIYGKTQTAATESDFTAIARACAKVIPEKGRSQADSEYATRLFAWALNRRGEVRGEAAAKLVQQGALEDAQKLDKQAAADFQTAVEYAPDNWRIHHNLAVAQAMQGKVQEAINSLGRVIQLKQDYPNAFFNRAELYFELKQFTRAAVDYTAAIDLAPQDGRFHNGRAHARFLLDQYADAITDYTKAAELDPSSAPFKTDLADALQYVGRWEEAANQYRQAIAADKTYARAYRNVAWLLSTCPEKQFRNPNLALSAARKAMELEGTKSYRTLDTLAAASAATGDSKAASDLMRQAIELAPAAEKPELQSRLVSYQRGQTYVQTAVKLPSYDASKVKSEVRTASATSDD